MLFISKFWDLMSGRISLHPFWEKKKKRFIVATIWHRATNAPHYAKCGANFEIKNSAYYFSSILCFFLYFLSIVCFQFILLSLSVDIFIHADKIVSTTWYTPLLYRQMACISVEFSCFFVLLTGRLDRLSLTFFKECSFLLEHSFHVFVFSQNCAFSEELLIHCRSKWRRIRKIIFSLLAFIHLLAAWHFESSVSS